MATIKIPVPNYTQAQKDRLREINDLQAVKLLEIAKLKREADEIYASSLVYAAIDKEWIGRFESQDYIKQAIVGAKVSQVRK